MILTGRNKTNRSGVTLVELLVVISIVVLLAAFTIPSMQPAMEKRRVRSAARSVRAYLDAARMSAIERSWPVGVLFQRDEIEPRACRVLMQVEVPPPYTGDFENATIQLSYNPLSDPSWLKTENMVTFVGVVDPFIAQVGRPSIQSDDVLQLNHMGHKWKLTISDTTPVPILGVDWWRVTLTCESDSTPNPPATSGNPVPALPFKFFRPPVPSAEPPLVLPRGTVIDLNDSGDRNDEPDFLPPLVPPGPRDEADVFAALDSDKSDPSLGKDDSPVMIMFSSGGGVDRVYHSYYPRPSAPPVQTDNYPQYGGRWGTRPIFLMIGRWDRAGEAGMLPEDGLHNWQDAENLWLALNPKTGQVTVAEVSTYYDHDLDPSTELQPYDDPATNTSRPPTVFDSRRYAQEARISRGGP